MSKTKSVSGSRRHLNLESSFALTTIAFRVFLGFIFFTVFLSLLYQQPTLIGSNGLLPIAEFLDEHPHLSFPSYPNIHIYFNSDIALQFLLGIGVIASILLIIGLAPKRALVACYIIYLASVISGRDFFYFQWDNLLLEASFLALFLPLKGNLIDIRKNGLPHLTQPPKTLIFLFRWLLFRLYFESGVAKLLYGQDDWLNWTGMFYYYETSPLPSFGGWFVQQMFPDWLHVVSIGIMLFIELVIPLLLFYPRFARIIAFYVLALFNLVIGITSNFGFFNLLCVVIGFFLLDDKHLHNIMSWINKRTNVTLLQSLKNITKSKTRKVSKITMVLCILITIFIVPFSISEFLLFTGRYTASEFEDEVYSWYRPFRMINRYHLFPGVVKERFVTEVWGSDDGLRWEQFRIAHTPNHIHGTPPWLPLHQARFPFQLSFIDGPRFPQYYVQFLSHLCTEPKNIQQLMTEPMNKPPELLRFDYYAYKFSEPSALMSKGEWWAKEYKGSTGNVPCERFRGHLKYF